MSGPFSGLFGGGGVIETYLDHTQTPNTFAGAALDIVRVNAGATAVEFIDSTSDFLTQYALIGGRSGGQIQIGGTDADDDYIIQSTSNVTKGSIKLDNYLILIDDALWFSLTITGSLSPTPVVAFKISTGITYSVFISDQSQQKHLEWLTLY